MTEFEYALSSEEFGPRELVRNARRAEEAGFTFALISDHYHPWISRQGHSPFVWNVIGGIAEATSRLRLGTGVTCPTFRIHPAIIAQAAATSAAMMETDEGEGRFFLGIGSGEALNEHILGDQWPPAEVRLEMLREAVEIIRLLWGGEEESFWGDYYTVENAQIFTRPSSPPPVYMAAVGPMAIELAGEIADGLISTAPQGDIVSQYRQSGGRGKPCYGQIKVCWARDEAQARKTVYEIWPNGAVPGSLHADLPTPDHFEAAVKLVREEDAVKDTVLGPDKRKHLEGIQKMIDAGYDHVYVHQIGPDQEGFFDFYEREILPEFL